MSNSFPAFTWLLAPIGVENFFHNYWEQQPVHVQRESPGYYQDTLSIDDLDRYFQTRHISPQFLSVLKDGNFCPPDQWTTTLRTFGGKADQVMVDVKKLLSLFKDGATIVINSGELAIPSLTELTRALEDELKFPVQANLYITPPQNRGFDPHFDTHNVFILHVHGGKHWRLYDAPVKSPVRNAFVEAAVYKDHEPQHSIQLQAGDLLYIPRGTVHCARAEEKTSIHITIGPLVRHWSAVLRILAQRADEDAGFRQLLPHGLSNPQEQADFSATFAHKLQDLLKLIDLPALTYATFVKEQKIDGRNRFTDMLQLEQLTSESIVCRRAHLNCLIKRDNEWIIISFEGEELSVPLFLEASMVTILQEEPFSIRQIEGIPNEAGKLALVRRFVQAGFLTVISV